MVIKELLGAIHDTGRWLLHVMLIPLLAALKATDAAVQYLITELSRV